MVFVLDKKKRPLMPCTERRARLLLQRGRAVVHRRVPFTIRLRDRLAEDSAVQPVVLKLDPGSRTSGVAVARETPSDEGPVHYVLHLAELQHRGEAVHERMLKRAAYRRRRRSANLRYRAPRFSNRRRSEGWLAPSLRSRVGNLLAWARRYTRWVPLTRVDLELARFDTQKVQNPEISGVQYQQGELVGHEVRAYLLEKWGRQCAYCGRTDLPLQIDHIMPRARGGSDRVTNLALACGRCNQEKADRTAVEYGHPEVQARTQVPLRDAAAINSTRRAVWRGLRALGLEVRCSTGGRTRYNRARFGVPKAHALDAACVGEISCVMDVDVPVLRIRATGRGQRSRTLVDAQGFPRGYRMRRKSVQGFQTGDLVRARVPAGRHAGTHVGRVAVRARGEFRVGRVDGVSWRYCTLLQGADGYEYGSTAVEGDVASATP